MIKISYYLIKNNLWLKMKKIDNAATSEFIESITSQREIKEPIPVGAHAKKEKYRTADDYEIPYDPVTDADHPYEKWRTKPLLKCLCSREIARYLDRKTFIEVSVREAFIYSLFIILLTVVTFGSSPLDMFYFSQAMTTLYTKQTFKGGPEVKTDMTFYEINSLSDVVQYLRNLLGEETLFNDYWYQKPSPSRQRKEHYYENKLIGMPQLRHIKVRNNTCELQKSVKFLFSSCFGPYTSENEEKEGTIYNYKELNESLPRYFQDITWSSPEETKSMTLRGSVGSYRGGGYRIILSNDRNDQNKLTPQRLDSLMWFDHGTRVIFLEFVVYNGNINLFCIFKLIFERPPSGGMIPSHWSYVQKLIRYNDDYDFVVLGCEIVLVLFLILFTIQKIMEIFTLRLKVFTTFWCWVDLVILAMCYTVIGSDIALYLMIQNELPDLVSKKNKYNYASFDQLSTLHIFYSYCFAILIAFAFFRLFKYLTIIQSMYQLQATISRAGKNLLSYGVIFLYIYMLFAMIGVFLFGTKVEDYQSLSTAVFALMRYSVGDFNYYKLQEADPVGGPLFFLSFIFLMAWVLVNVFLAILVSTYEEVRSEVKIGGVKTFLGHMISYWFVRGLEKINWYWMLSQVQDRQYKQKARSPTESIRQYLRLAGYSELEIELFFKKYDITDAKISAIDQKEIERGTSKMGERSAPPPLTQKDILRYIIVQKLEYLEGHYEASNKLLDDFLSKLTKYESKR